MLTPSRILVLRSSPSSLPRRAAVRFPCPSRAVRRWRGALSVIDKVNELVDTVQYGRRFGVRRPGSPARAPRRRRAQLQPLLHAADRSAAGEAAPRRLLAHRAAPPVRARAPPGAHRLRAGQRPRARPRLLEPHAALLRAARARRAAAIDSRRPQLAALAHQVRRQGAGSARGARAPGDRGPPAELERPGAADAPRFDEDDRGFAGSRPEPPRRVAAPAGAAGG